MDMGLIAAGRGDNAVNVCELVIAKLHFEANGIKAYCSGD